MQELDTQNVSDDLDITAIEKELAGKHRVSAIAEAYDPPELDYTKEDLAEFTAMMVFGDPWSERFSRDLVEITFRTRSRKESEFITAVVDGEARSNIIRSQAQLASRLNTLNIILSATDYRGNQMPSWTIPARPWTDAHYKEFAAFVEAHPLSDMPEPLYFILMAILVQFQDKCYRMQKSIIEGSEKPGFSRPGAAS